MNIKVNGEYLDFDGNVVVERQWKLFEDISSIVGDVSFQFNIPITTNNRTILGLLSINETNKRIYSVNSVVLENNGMELNRGSLRVELVNDQISARFLSGNSSWINLLSGNIFDLDLFSFGVGDGNTSAEITATFSNTEGVIFTPIDSGMVNGYIVPILKTTDFIPVAYIKTIFSKIFTDLGIKLQGDLFTHWAYQHLTVGNNGLSASKEQLSIRESFVGASNQVVPIVTPTIIEYNDDSNFPFFDGSRNNFDPVTYTYTADKPMLVDVIIYVKMNTSQLTNITINRNGSPVLGFTKDTNIINFRPRDNAFFPGDYITLATGDVLHIEILSAASGFTIEEATLKIVPYRFRAFYPQFLAGNMTKKDFVGNIFRMFNVICSFDNVSKVLTCNFFNDIKNKQAVDLSDYLSKGESETNYEELVQDYGKDTLISYSPDDNDLIEGFNNKNKVPYGSGLVRIDNDYIQPDAEIPIDFVNSIMNFCPVIGSYLPRIVTQEASESDVIITIASVASDAGQAEFTTSTNHGLAVGNWVRILSTTDNVYLGIGKVDSVDMDTQFTLFGVDFISNQTGTLVKLNVNEITKDDPLIFLTVPNIPVSNISTLTEFDLETDTLTSIPFSWFTKPDMGLGIDAYKQQLSFDNPGLGYSGLFMKEQFYRVFSDVVNDPVFKRNEFILPQSVYLSLSGLNPVELKTENHSSVFYLNKITGYENSQTPVELELIKIG